MCCGGTCLQLKLCGFWWNENLVLVILSNIYGNEYDIISLLYMGVKLVTLVVRCTDIVPVTQSGIYLLVKPIFIFLNSMKVC